MGYHVTFNGDDWSKAEATVRNIYAFHQDVQLSTVSGFKDFLKVYAISNNVV